MPTSPILRTFLPDLRCLEVSFLPLPTFISSFSPGFQRRSRSAAPSQPGPFLAGMPMGRNGGPKLSLPLLPGQRGGQGPECPLPPLSSSPLLGAFCRRNQSGPVCLLLCPGDREISLLLCYCTPPDTALLTAHCYSHPYSPRRFISARSNGIPFWGTMGNEVL